MTGENQNTKEAGAPPLEILILGDLLAPRRRFVAVAGGVVAGRGKNPFFDACSSLQQNGADPDQIVVMKWAKTGTISFRGRLGVFAGLEVVGNGSGTPIIAKRSKAKTLPDASRTHAREVGHGHRL